MGDSQHHLYNQQMETVRSFFFSLLILGYVEDPVSGMSFQFPLGLSWIIFIEVRMCAIVHVVLSKTRCYIPQNEIDLFYH